MCYCCPPAIQALFCLWVRSGFSKASVAGALTFFPPDPPLYKFNRVSKEGELLPEEPDDDKERVNITTGVNEDDILEQQLIEDILEEEDSYGNVETTSNRTGVKPETQRKKRTTKSKTRHHHDIEPSEEDESVLPAKSLTKRAEQLRMNSKNRNASDVCDDAAGVSYIFIPDPRLPVPPSFSGTIESFKIGPEPKTKNYIAAVLYRIRSDRQTPRTKTIIYSHGNATDIGAMNFMQSVMAKGLQANVLMYDYSGYGVSGGVPLEGNTYHDIKMVYKWVTENVVHDQNERQIVVYGQSVGSGPSCYLCARNENVGGLILHSPFMSGMRVLTSSRALACLDIYPNINRMKQVHCPVLVIHGAMDEEVDISHGQTLHEAVREDLKREPWWVPDRGHNDITDGRVKLIEYITRLKAYLRSLDN